MTKHGLTARERITLHTEADPATGCWNWTGNIAHNGYGRIGFEYRLYVAHRFAYETLIGPVPAGLELDHLCRNRRCVNPQHLEPVTPRENQHRARKIGHDHPKAPRACKRGHDPSERRRYPGLTNGRIVYYCRGCKREYQAERRARSSSRVL